MSYSYKEMKCSYTIKWIIGTRKWVIIWCVCARECVLFMHGNELFIQGNKLFIKVFHTREWVIHIRKWGMLRRKLAIHTRKWIVHTGRWGIHTREWIIHTKGVSFSYMKITYTCMNNSLFEGNLWVRGEHLGSETLSPPWITCFVLFFFGEMGN